MSTRFRVRCERVRANNGIIELLFIRRSDMTEHSDEEIFLMNLKVPADRYEVGREYWLHHPEPAFPH